MVSVTNEMLRQRCLVRVTQTVPPNPTPLQMSRVDREDVSLPFARGETHPCMRRSVRRMAAAIHPYGPGLLIIVDVLLDGDQLLRNRVALFPDPEVVGTAIDVRQNVHFALMLGYGETRCIPGQPIDARSVRDGNTGVVRQFRARSALVGVFVHDGAPVSCQIDSGPDGIVAAWSLRKSGACKDQEGENHDTI